MVSGGSTFRYLTKVARGPEFDYLRNYLYGKGAENLASNNLDGVQRCRDDKYYAFIIESSSADYSLNFEPCDLMTVGGIFAKRSYGMPYRKDLDQGIVDRLHIATMELIEEGLVEAMEDKWFKHGACWNVTKLNKMVTYASLQLNKPKTVDLHMLWAPLVMLLCGVLFAILTSIAEGIYFNMRGKVSCRTCMFLTYN